MASAQRATFSRYLQPSSKESDRGVGAAVFLRVIFAVSAVFLLEIQGVLVAGGLMLRRERRLFRI